MSDKSRLSDIVIRLIAIAGMVLLITVQFLSSSVAAVKIGMVLQVKGEIFPPLKQYSQIINQKSFDLADDAFLELAIYADCKIIQIKGPGILNFQDELLWSGSQLEEKTNVGCVKPLVYSNPNLQKAGINLRGEAGMAIQSRLQKEETLLIPSKPTIIFDGISGHENHELIVVGNGERFRVRLESAIMNWPDNVADLVPGENYQFHFIKDNRQSDEVYDARIEIPDAASSDSQGYLVIRFQ
jgi:hypothetical protein